MKKYIMRLFILCIVIFYVVLIHDLKTTTDTNVESKENKIENEQVLTKDKNTSLIPQSSIYVDFPTQNQNEINSKKSDKETSETEDEIDYGSEMNKELKKIESIKDKRKWFVEYKKIIKKYQKYAECPKTIYDEYTENELDLLFRVVQAEIGDYTFEQKCNVVSVIFNRIGHEEFPNTLFEVLTPDQFETISNGRIYEMAVDNTTKLACEYVFEFGDTTGGALFFDSNGALNYNFIYNDGAHNFYKLSR